MTIFHFWRMQKIRKPLSAEAFLHWIPAFAGMTKDATSCVSTKISPFGRNDNFSKFSDEAEDNALYAAGFGVDGLIVFIFRLEADAILFFKKSL